jgi:hypothetical protein
LLRLIIQQKTSLHYKNTSEIPVFNLLKLHGSVNWKKENENIVLSDFLEFHEAQEILGKLGVIIDVSDESSIDSLKVDAEKIYELLEETLIDVMALFRNDNSTSEYREYSEIVSIFSLLADALVSIAPEYTEKVDTLYAHFPG